MDKKYVVYKVTNRFDGKFYIGVHTTKNKNDRYMGSGVEIKEALKKFGRKSFTKEILFEFDTWEEMLAKEKELVTKEFCMREDTYNRIEGGGTYVTHGMIPVINKNGGHLLVYKDDPRYISGEFVHHVKGTVTVLDSEGRCFRVAKDDPRYLSGELKHNMVGKVAVRDKHGKCFIVSKDDEQYLSGDLVPVTKGYPQKGGFKGHTCSEEHRNKIGKANSVKQKGELNSQFGTCWITNEIENKKIKKEELTFWVKEGWRQGRKIS